MPLEIAAFANADDAFVVWRADAPIDGCLGFALHRRRDGTEEVVDNYVGFAGDAGLSAPSTTWPFQRFRWTDHLVSTGDRVAYRVVPMLGPRPLRPDDAEASAWTDDVEVSGGGTISAHFNRGIVQTQWVAKLLENVKRGHELETLLNTVGGKERAALAGELRETLVALLERVDRDGDEIYAALFELDDEELEEALARLGKRAHVILANGAHTDGKDRSAAARTRLKNTIDLHDRLPTSGLAHNKFLVVCSGGAPTHVWTGSTNWTTSGLCTQANNGLLVASEALGEIYLAQWKLIDAAGNDFPKSLQDADAQPKPATVDGLPVTVWFTPQHGRHDLKYATDLIGRAEQAIFFLMYNPGKTGTLLNEILDRDVEAGSKLYIRGVLNQDPGGKKHPILRYDSSGKVPLSPDVLLPAAISDPFARWRAELAHGLSNVMVHSKCIVLDPLGRRPIVMTGSHNLGHHASEANDDNLIVIEGDRPLALAYAVAIKSVYDNYLWRETQLAGRKPNWRNLSEDPGWQKPHFEHADSDAAFWLLPPQPIELDASSPSRSPDT
jgi:phosphatidylserine/phosphatidylglycerophosphate/cardiolipin synthase-like enzyme